MTGTRKRRAHRQESRFVVFAEVVVSTSVVALVCCFGGAPWWTLPLLIALSFVATATYLVGVRSRHRLQWHPVLLLPCLVATVAVLQLVPLPAGVLAALSGPQARLRDFTLVPLGLTEFRPVSVDPPSTWRAIARALALSGLLFTSLQLARRSEVRMRLLGTVAITAFAIAVCGFLHLLAGADSLFGAYQFVATSYLITPFGNKNHLAAFLTLGSLIGLGLGLRARAREEALAWGGVGLVSAVATLLSLSRGGAAAFLAGALVLGWVAWKERKPGFRSLVPILFAAGALVGAAVLDLEPLLARLETISSFERLQASKLELLPMFWAGAMRVWPAGLGFGAFEVGFGQFQTEQLNVTFTHPENLVLQWFSELGLPAALLMAVVSVVLLGLLWRGTKDHVAERVALIALGAVLVHDLFDFSLELNGVAPAFTVVLGVVAGAAHGDARLHAVRPRIWVGFAALLALATFAAWRGLPSHAVAESTLAHAAQQDLPRREFLRLGMTAIDRHPGDWLLYATMANDEARRGSPAQALAWVNRELDLRPQDARAHTVAARALTRLGKGDQALSELKLAWEQGDLSTLPWGLELAERSGNWDRFLVAQPGVLPAAWSQLQSTGRSSQAASLVAAALDFAPTEVVTHEARLLQVRQLSETNPAEALALLDKGTWGENDAQQLQVLRAHLLSITGRADQAIAVLRDAQLKSPADVSLATQLVELLLQRGSAAEAFEVISRLKPLVGTEPGRLAVLELEASVAERLERWGRAADVLETASRMRPQSPAFHYRLGRAYEHLGRLRRALEEARKGQVLDSEAGARSQDPWVVQLESVLHSQQ